MKLSRSIVELVHPRLWLVMTGKFDSYNGRFALTGAKGDNDDLHESAMRPMATVKIAIIRLVPSILPWTGRHPIGLPHTRATSVRSEHGLTGQLTRAELKADKEHPLK